MKGLPVGFVVDVWLEQERGVINGQAQAGVES